MPTHQKSFASLVFDAYYVINIKLIVVCVSM